MNDIINIYCDESCHLEHDRSQVMVLGCVWCPQQYRHDISTAIRELKERHGLPRSFDVKWTKVSPAKIAFYRELVDLFFDDTRLHFRGIVISGKKNLDHNAFRQTHDDFYYKMYFQLLTMIFEAGNRYRVYLDIKDTRSQEKVTNLINYLSNAHYDFNREMIERIQHVRSQESDMVQLADLFSGALTYLHRGLKTSRPKAELITHIVQRSGFKLTCSTLPSEKKFNVFVWTPRDHHDVA